MKSIELIPKFDSIEVLTANIVIKLICFPPILLDSVKLIPILKYNKYGESITETVYYGVKI